MISSGRLDKCALAAGFLFLVGVFGSGSMAQNPITTQALPTPSKTVDRNGYLGNEACASCHFGIYESYQRTAMARASGPAIAALTPAEFTHKESGVHYRIYSESGHAWLSSIGREILTSEENANFFTTSARDVVAEATCLRPMDSSSSLR